MIYLLIAAFLWGTSFIAGKIAYDMLDPSLVVAIRYILASIILLPMTFSFMKKKRNLLQKRFYFTCNIRNFNISSYFNVTVYRA